MAFETNIRVRYAETDKMGVVYHANYLVYFEIARTAFLDSMGFPYDVIERAGYMFPVVDAQLHYSVPLQYGDVAVVRTRLVTLKPAKFELAYDVYKEGQDFEHDKPLVFGRTTHAMVAAGTFKPVNVKKKLPELYAVFQEMLEEE